MKRTTLQARIKNWALPVPGKVDISTPADKSSRKRRHNSSEIELQQMRNSWSAHFRGSGHQCVLAHPLLPLSYILESSKGTIHKKGKAKGGLVIKRSELHAWPRKPIRAASPNAEIAVSKSYQDHKK